jgi:hypothetical protein
MWTDINTKPKKGVVYRAFRGHVMGIPADYVDKEYKGKVKSTLPISLMLLVPKEPKASQEYVGGSQKGENLTARNEKKLTIRIEKSLIGTGKLSLMEQRT